MIRFVNHRLGRFVALLSLIAGSLLTLRLYRYIRLQRRLAYRAGVITGRIKEHARQWHEHSFPVM